MENQSWNILLSAGAASSGNETQKFGVRLGGEQIWYLISNIYIISNIWNLAVSNMFSYLTNICDADMVLKKIYQRL